MSTLPRDTNGRFITKEAAMAQENPGEKILAAAIEDIFPIGKDNVTRLTAKLVAYSVALDAVGFDYAPQSAA